MYQGSACLHNEEIRRLCFTAIVNRAIDFCSSLLIKTGEKNVAEKTLVVRGGNLIDGTGRTPIENSVIVIHAGRVQAVGRSGQIVIPADVEIIDVTGKTILPGFIDGHGHLEDFHGELYLHLGITTCANIELYQDGPWTLAQKQGTALGKIRGPRIWMSGRAIGGVSTGHDAFGSRTARDNIIVRTAEEVRRAVQRKKEMGCDILKVNEFLSMDLVKVACDEAHRLDMPVAAHSWDVVGYANAGVDAIEHIWSVGYSSIPYAPARRKLAEDRLGGVIDQELAGAYYQTENYDAVIEARCSTMSRGHRRLPNGCAHYHPVRTVSEKEKTKY